MPQIVQPVQHPERARLHNEIHARPPESLTAPLAITHVVMLADAQVRAASRAHLAQLLRDHHLSPPDDQTTHLRIALGPLRVRWELHTEFVSWTFMVAMPESVDSERTPASAAQAVPQSWLKALPGQCLCSLNVWALTARESDTHVLARHMLHEDTLIGSSVAGGLAEVYTDFAIHSDGSSRMLVQVGDMSMRRLGRLVQRLLEIETYRMAAMLGLPAAQQGELAALAEAIRTADRDAEPALLDRLTRLAGQVESEYAATHSRFSASTAYFELVDRRIQDINESRLAGLQTIAEFMDRRLTPARKTCEWATRRQDALSVADAHARGDRAATKQPGAAGHHEPTPGPAAAAAVHRGGPVGCRHHLLHSGPGELPGQGGPESGLALVGRDHRCCGDSDRGRRRVVVVATAAPSNVQPLISDSSYREMKRSGYY
jgi:uncharacterized membrane-anchored protein